MNPAFLNAAAALNLISKMQDAHAQNLANASTVGYRKRLTSAEAFSSALRQASGLDTPKLKEGIDFSSGDLRDTDQPLDVAVEGKGFFVIKTERGERFTRAGAFQLDADGFLVTQNGEKVDGRTGPIQLDPQRGKPSIDTDGRVTQGGEQVGAIRVVEFADERELVAEDSGMFRAPQGARPREATTSKVRQHMLEAANVNVVDELVQMISGFRSFEAVQKTLLGIDRVKSQAINQR